MLTGLIYSCFLQRFRVYTMNRPKNGAKMAREFNDNMAAVIAEHPDRFAGLAVLPLQEPARGRD